LSNEFADELIDHHILLGLSIDPTINSSHIPTMYSDFLEKEKLFGGRIKFLANTHLDPKFSDAPNSSWKDEYLAKLK
jgi:hypothetical protein